jgi:uncharacterized protein YjdB
MLSGGSDRSVSAGGTLQLVAKVMPENASNKITVWSSSNPFIASVDGTGLVTAQREGTVTITAITYDGGYTLSYKVTVQGSDSTDSTGTVGDISWWWLLIVLAIVAVICLTAVTLFSMHIKARRA